jgi:hypothetical protein
LEKFIPPQVVLQGIDGRTLSNCRTITEVQSVFAGINTASVGIFTSRPCCSSLRVRQGALLLNPWYPPHFVLQEPNMTRSSLRSR